MGKLAAARSRSSSLSILAFLIELPSLPEIPLRYLPCHSTTVFYAMDMNEQIREAAEQARARFGLTQDDVAMGAGVKQATVSRLLAGERAGEPDTWLRILDVLELELVAVPRGVDVSRLFEEGVNDG